MATLQLKRYLERNTIKHPTALLHFRRQLSDFEQGILFLCVHIIAKTERDTDGFYYLNKSLVRAVMRQEGNQDYARINEAVDRVSETKLKLNFWGEDRTFDDYEAPLIIGKATSKRRGTIAFEVHPRLEQVIKDPRVFARLNIHFIAALADVHRGYAFYALFKDAMNRQRDPEILEETYSYRELRTYLGVDETAYPVFKEFKKYVLKPLIDAVNERTDLHLSYEPVKTGRKLTHLKFTVRAQSWQLQLFEAEHAKRLVEELAKNFDGPVIDTKVVPAIEAGTDQKHAGLIDQCVKMGVTSSTVQRAIKAHGVQGVEEIIAYTQKQLAKKDKKGESYETGQYLAKMLNDGVGIKTVAARNKEAAARQRIEERAAAKAAQTAAEQAEEALQAQFFEHQKARASQLLKKRPPADLAKLGEAVADTLPSFADYRRRWAEIDQDYTQLDQRKMTDKTIYRTWVVQAVLKLWGEAGDLGFEEYKKSKSVTA